MQGLDRIGTARRPQLAAQIVEMRLHRVFPSFGIERPELLQELAAADQAARMAQEPFQQLPFPLGERQGHPQAEHLSRRGVQGERPPAQ